jgi:hypothetical protein
LKVFRSQDDVEEGLVVETSDEICVPHSLKSSCGIRRKRSASWRSR